MLGLVHFLSTSHFQDRPGSNCWNCWEAILYTHLLYGIVPVWLQFNHWLPPYETKISSFCWRKCWWINRYKTNICTRHTFCILSILIGMFPLLIFRKKIQTAIAEEWQCLEIWIWLWERKLHMILCTGGSRNEVHIWVTLWIDSAVWFYHIEDLLTVWF